MLIRHVVTILLLTATLSACAGKRFEYTPASEIPPGPGMFSGEDGEFIIYSDERKQKEKEKAAAMPEDFKDFQAYQEFQAWKESNKDSAEFREFQDYREWKSYRAWKQQQQGK